MKRIKNFLNNKIDKIFFMLLKRYLVKRMDQWERWHIKEDGKDFYVELTREPDGYEYTTVESKDF